MYKIHGRNVVTVNYHAYSTFIRFSIKNQVPTTHTYATLFPVVYVTSGILFEYLKPHFDIDRRCHLQLKGLLGSTNPHCLRGAVIGLIKPLSSV
jgi:hypothetical protein